jgi:transposase-like protein
LNPHEVFCPNLDCPARGQIRQGNIWIHSRKHQRYRCTQCQKTFTATMGTPFYGLRTAVETVTLVVTLLAHGCPPQAIVAAFGLDERTVFSWQARAGLHCQEVHQHLVEQPRLHGEVQLDELRVKAQGAILWLASALHVPTRLWLGGELSPSRDKGLIRRLLERVRRCVQPHAWVLLCTDGLSSYWSQAQLVFRERVASGRRGRPRLVLWPKLLVAQVVKRYKQRRVIGVDRRIKRGSTQQVRAVQHRPHPASVLNTAYVERHNGTLRQKFTALVRRGRALLRPRETMQWGMWLVGTVYNFCTLHESLRVRLSARVRPTSRQWAERTPAVAAGLTEHCWSVKELLWYRVPPPWWRPPKRRGRLSEAMKLTIIRWCHT